MFVTAIIPAYNEESRIADVLKVLSSIERINQVLVVDDGSEDHTAEVAEGYFATVIRMPENGGKASAMCAGVLRATNDIIMFLDADLIGLQAKHVRELLDPVLLGKAEMSVGIFSSGRTTTDMAQFVSPQLSGQRVLKKEQFLRVAQGMEDAGYGIESIITKYSKKEDWEVAIVEFEGVSHVMKEEKLGFSKGSVARLKMYLDIIKTVGAGKKVTYKKKNDTTFIG